MGNCQSHPTTTRASPHSEVGMQRSRKIVAAVMQVNTLGKQTTAVAAKTPSNKLNLKVVTDGEPVGGTSNRVSSPSEETTQTFPETPLSTMDDLTLDATSTPTTAVLRMTTEAPSPLDDDDHDSDSDDPDPSDVLDSSGLHASLPSIIPEEESSELDPSSGRGELPSAPGETSQERASAEESKEEVQPLSADEMEHTAPMVPRRKKQSRSPEFTTLFEAAELLEDDGDFMMIREEIDPTAPSDEEDSFQRVSRNLAEWEMEPGDLPALSSIDNKNTRSRGVSPPRPQSSIKLRHAKVTRPNSIVYHEPPLVVPPKRGGEAPPEPKSPSSVDRHTLAHFNKLKVQIKLAQHQEKLKRRAEKLEDRYEDVRMHRTLMKDFEKIQKTVKETPDRAPREHRRSRSFDLKQTSSWFFDFQSIESTTNDRGGTDDDDGNSSLSSNMSLLSSASLDMQRKYYATKRKKRNRFVDNPQDWDQPPIITSPLDLKVVAHHQSPARQKKPKDAPGKQPKGIDPPGSKTRSKTSGVGIAPPPSSNKSSHSKGTKQGMLRRALSSPGSIFGGPKKSKGGKGSSTKPGSFQAAVSPPQKSKRDAPGGSSNSTLITATGLGAQLAMQQQLVTLRSHLGEYQEHDALRAMKRRFDKPIVPDPMTSPPEQTIKHVYSAEDDSWDADDDNDYNVRRRRRAQPGTHEFGDDLSVGTDDHSLINKIVGGEPPAICIPNGATKSIPVLPPTFAQQLAECDKEAAAEAAAAARKKRRDENAEPSIDLESVKQQAELRLRSARIKANSRDEEEEHPKLVEPPSVGRMTTEEFLRLAAEHPLDEYEDQQPACEYNLEGRRLEFGDEVVGESSAAVRNGREQAALAHADIVTKEVHELLARFKSDTAKEAVAAAAVQTQ